MPRVARIVVPGCPHHITQRGNNRQDVFFTDDDRRLYLKILAEQTQRRNVRVLGYCLMTNHVHVIATPADERGLAAAIGRTHWLYSQTLNRLHGRSGHLWQNRFFSCALDEPHLWAALRYVENNPVRARLVRRAWAYPWSSAGPHVGTCRAPEKLLDLTDWRRTISPADWRDHLAAALGDDDREALRNLRLHTSRGRPLGSDRFVAKLEAAMNRRLRALPEGRPRTVKERGPRRR